MSIWKSAGGTLDVELTSAEMENSLSAINGAGIIISALEDRGALTTEFRIRRGDYLKLSALCEKRGEKLRILKNTGLYFVGKQFMHRPYLLFGIVFLCAVMLYLPTRVLFVQVEGNREIPTSRILAAAGDCGIYFGASRRAVRSEKMKNALLSQMPELQWAGVNTYGCVAVISVREGAQKKAERVEKMVTSIVAARDGYILSGTVTHGNALYQVGETVKQGQILISGYTDCGICIQATRAEGEIVAQTNRKIEAVTPLQCLLRGKRGEVKRKYSLLFRKKRINLWKDSGISTSSCGRMYEEYYVTLPGGFRMPVAFCIEEYISYELKPGEVQKPDAVSSLSYFSQRYLTEQMVAGRILHKQEQLFLSDGLYCLEGDYICEEMIGREQREQIGETNG